jgi:hypothetical protein
MDDDTDTMEDTRQQGECRVRERCRGIVQAKLLHEISAFVNVLLLPKLIISRYLVEYVGQTAKGEEVALERNTESPIPRWPGFSKLGC